MPPIGETLREARMRQKLDVADVEARTKIRAKYLRALENEEWGTLPGPTFVRTFLRTYADLVGVDAHLLLEEYRLNHDPSDEFDASPRAGRPAASRRQPRRRASRGPPSKGAVAAGLAMAFVGFLLVLGLLAGGDEEPRRERAGREDAPGETTPPAPQPRPAPAPAPPPKGVTVRLAPAEATYACLDAGQGTAVVFEGIVEAPRTFKHASRLRVNLGKRAVDLRLNGKLVRITPSGDPVGFDLTPTGATEIPAGTRPCA